MGSGNNERKITLYITGLAKVAVQWLNEHLYFVSSSEVADSLVLLKNLKPSEADKELTNKIKKASEYMDIKLLDHLIIVPEGKYLSFTEDGLL